MYLGLRVAMGGDLQQIIKFPYSLELESESLEWHNVHTKLHENLSSHSQVTGANAITSGQWKQNQWYKLLQRIMDNSVTVNSHPPT
jgi:hypothetical protein